LDDKTGAIADFTEVIKLNPTVARPYFNRGVSTIKLGDKDGACNDWKKAAELKHEKAIEIVNKFYK